MSDVTEALLQRTLARAAELRRLPVSTYRLQFHKGFTFRDATSIVPYLAKLGVTHVYASPYLKATPGSTHGYDVIDHCTLNPEVGTTADYDAFLSALNGYGLTHILDTVPNHVGVATNDNKWWNDVLEHGPASPFADYFDITWTGNARPEMAGKVLVPTLGKSYAAALEGGELTLKFEPEDGSFALFYYARRFPISPATYGRILVHAGGAPLLRGLLDEIDAIPADGADRYGQAQQIKTRLATLVAEHGSLRQTIQSAVDELNGTAGDPRSFDALDTLLAEQHFRLADWHVAFDEINYRRFFDVNDLAALKMENPEVFEATHSFILPLLAAGKISGLRIDHPDGLYDPAQYLLRLQQHYLLAIARTLYTGDAWPSVRQQMLGRLQSFDGVGDGQDRWPLFVSIEKILALGEPLPPDWATHGTSGYDFLITLNNLFIDAASEPTFDALWTSLAGDTSYEELVYRNKRMMLETSLASELHMLASRLDNLARRDRRGRDFTFRTLLAAVRETVACFGVYRSYVVGDRVGDTDAEQIRGAVDRAKVRNPRIQPGVFDYLADMLLQHYPAGADDAARTAQQQFAGKFQQLTSPVTAKGIEDTTFYQYDRLLSLNEVGGEPNTFGLSAAEVHRAFADRQARWPYALSAMSTHDTKRSEDVRARLNGLTEVADDWAACVHELFDFNADLRQTANGKTSPTSADEYLIYQTVLGAWPMLTANVADDRDFIDRIQAYTLKAIREAKVNTRWGEPDEQYEAGVKAFIDGLLARPPAPKYAVMLQTMSAQGARYGLAQTLIKLTAPGVPDTYQGTELWDLSLVDPDNRRPVDYASRERLLAEVDGVPAAGLMASFADGRVKLKLTAEALRLRRTQPELFGQGTYTPLSVSGPYADRLFAFARTHGTSSVLTIAAIRRRPESGWADTTVNLPAGNWTDVLNDREVKGGSVSDLIEPLGIALLARHA